MTPIFLDTETTGNHLEDRLIQLAYKYRDVVVNELFKPSLPIKIEAMAVHHITEKMVADKYSFEGSTTRSELRETLLEEDSVLVAHNAKFDIGMLEKEYLEIPRFICTLKVAKHLDKDAKIESFSLQYLRYFLGIEVEASAHDALGDILVLEKLFERLSAKMSIEEMIEVSNKPSLIQRFTFGKHKGLLLSEVDDSYLTWLLNEKKKEEVQDEDWIYTLNYYLNNHD